MNIDSAYKEELAEQLRRESSKVGYLNIPKIGVSTPMEELVEHLQCIRSKVGIPRIDMSAPKKELAGQLRHACSEVGFFYLFNHEVEELLTDGVLSAAKCFFSKPLEEKMRSARKKYNSKNDNVYFGYFPIENGKEGLDMNRSDYPSYFDAVFELGWTLVEYLGPFLPCSATSTLRLLRYPEGGSCAEHTDSGLLTILYQEAGSQGLQVQNRAGEWLDVPPVSGAFVVNVGEALADLSGGTILAANHRVIGTLAPRITIFAP